MTLKWHSLGKKNKAGKKKEKKQRKLLKKQQKALGKSLDTRGCKSKCCEKYCKGEDKRCSRCPCFDLLQKVA